MTLMFVARFQQRTLREYLNGTSNRQSKYISEGTQKWTLSRSKVVPPGGPVFGPFILSDVLKFCKLLCAQSVKLEATDTNSIRGRTLELGRPVFASPIFLIF